MCQGACSNSCVTAQIARVDRVVGSMNRTERVNAALTKVCEVGGVKYLKVTPKVVWVSTEITATVEVESNLDWTVE